MHGIIQRYTCVSIAHLVNCVLESGGVSRRSILYDKPSPLSLLYVSVLVS